MKKGVIIAVVVIIGVVLAVVFVPNPVEERVRQELKARGYLEYTPEEAVKLAYTRCTTCHSEEKMLKYCSRCGPPFIVVVHYMKKYIDIAQKKGTVDVKQLTDAEAIAIIQVWNAMVGNWEGDWRKKDLKKLLENDVALIEFLDVPVEKRPIEMALRGRTAPGAYRYQQEGL